MWSLKNKNFLLWLDLESVLGILWGTGIPGAGKSVMISVIIKELEARAPAAGGTICVAYIFFRYSDATDPTVRRVLDVLVKQTVESHPDYSLLTEQVYVRHHTKGTQPTKGQLLTLLHRFVAAKSMTTCSMRHPPDSSLTCSPS